MHRGLGGVGGVLTAVVALHLGDLAEVLLEEVAVVNSRAAEPEGIDDLHQGRSVVGVSGNKKIHIAGVARPAMECQRPSTDDEISNTLRVQQANEFAQIAR